MRVGLPVLLVILKYVDSPPTARIRLAVRRMGRRGIFEGIEQVPGESEDCVISVSESGTKLIRFVTHFGSSRRSMLGARS